MSNVTGASPDSAARPVMAHVALFVVSVLFGGNYVVAKVALREVTPLDLVLIRTWGTAVVLFGALRLRRRSAPTPPLTRTEWRELFVYSLLGATINQLCFLAGLARTTATNASLMLVSIPLLTLAFAVLLGRERATPTGVLGILIGLTGALILLVPRGGVHLARSAVVGNVLLLIGAVAYALFLVLTRPMLMRRDPLFVMSWVFLLAAVTVLPFDLPGLIRLFSSHVSVAGWLSIAYVVIGATVIPYLFNSWALARVKSSVVAVYILLQPVVASALGRLVLGERFGPHAALAAVLVVTGVAVSGWRPRSRSA
jgi:drug/metabolite transporter (DMT)-like permease